MLISNHKSLAEQLVAADVTAVLKKCLSLSRTETMLAIIALNHISMVHRLESKGRSHDTFGDALTSSNSGFTSFSVHFLLWYFCIEKGVPLLF